MQRNEFEQLVGEVLDALPPHIIAVLDRVVVCVEHDSENGDRLGEYRGIPRTERDESCVAVPPDQIILYHKAIEDEVGEDPTRVREEIRRTLLHEIAHHLGHDEEWLEDAEHTKGWHEPE